jgi:hypothetical protein
VRIAVFVLPIIVTEFIVRGSGRISNELMNGGTNTVEPVEMLSTCDVDDGARQREMFPLDCARTYISSNHGFFCGKSMTISTPVYVSTMTRNLICPVLAAAGSYQNEARTR